MDSEFINLEESALLQENGEDVALELLSGEYIGITEIMTMEYPCLIMKGLSTEEEFLYFSNRICKDACALPLYCEIDGINKRVGKIDLELDTLLSLHQIANYELKLLRSEMDSVLLDLNDAETYIKFIRLS